MANDPKGELANYLNNHFKNENIQVTKIHMKNFLTCLIKIREANYNYKKYIRYLLLMLKIAENSNVARI